MARFSPKLIFSPIDLSAASPIVLRWAGLFAEPYQAKLEIIHAEWLEYPPYFLPSQAAELTAMAKRTRTALTESLRQLATENIRKGMAYEISVLEGHPVETILKHVKERKPDLIVMGSHGRTGLARMRLGSVAESVAQQTSIPTLIVHTLGGKPAPSRIARILCPVDFAEYTKQSLSISAELSAVFGAQLIVMHVAATDKNLAKTQKQLCDAVPDDVRKHCDEIEVARSGNPAEQILLVAREHAADIITLSAVHRRFLEFTAIGATTERVLRHADSAVLILPAGQGGPA